MDEPKKFYRIDCWIPVEAEEPQVYDNQYEAQDDADNHYGLMQPENKYEVVECKEDGKDLD